MEAKSKAKELLNKFAGVSWACSIETTLLCIDEILSNYKREVKNDFRSANIVDYWNEVRKEVEL